jgi:hypothetical protein
VVNDIPAPPLNVRVMRSGHSEAAVENNHDIATGRERKSSSAPAVREQCVPLPGTAF